jgi:uncharacterized membrane protein HdeD (DUF308 family)
MEDLRRSRSLFIFEGIAFILLGILAIALPGIMTLGVELFVGWLLLIGGLVQGYRTLQAYEAPGFWASLLSSLLSIVIGVLFLVYPLQGVLTLTLLLMVFFFVEALAKIIFAFQIKPVQGWGWLLVSGILALGMGLIIFAGWPSTAVWVIGLLVGINMLFFGSALLSLAYNVKKPSVE